MLQVKKWLYKKTDKRIARQLESETGLSAAVAELLVGRGFSTAEAVQEFLHGSEQPFHDPMLLLGMEKAVKRIVKAVDSKAKITVYGDYDVDGMTASSLMVLFFKNLGMEIEYYIPERQTEGYGLNSEAIQKIAQEGTDLLLTVDCGISSAKEIARAPKGLDIIITDHHTPPLKLPKAFSVINPKQEGCPYPYKELAGVGVAFKLCQALWSVLGKGAGLYSRHLDIVALGTIADVVPMTGENREIVRKGLVEINSKLNLGIQALAQVADVADKKISTGHVGFMLAPRLNAAGRLSSARMGVKLLTTDNDELAQTLACQLNEENQQRQKIERQILLQAEQLITEQGGAKEVILLASPDWHTGVIGIVASRLVEKYTRPVIMISIGEDICKASCRSISAFDMYAALDFSKEYLAGYGGHKQAAGFSVLETNIGPLYKKLIEYATIHLCAEDYLPVQRVDVKIDDLSEINEKLLQEIDLLEPYGIGNPSPVFAASAINVRNVFAIGEAGKHLRFVAEKNKKNHACLFWNQGELKKMLYDGAQADIAFVPELNEWQGQKKINLRLLDVKQEQVVVDLRQENTLNQKKYFTAILQENKNIYLYPENTDVNTADVKTVVLEKSESLIFLQPPYLLIDDASWWQEVKKSSVKRVYLLYNKENVQAKIACLDKTVPEVDWLRDIYRFVKDAGTVSEEKLQLFAGKEKPIATALLVLQEMGAIKRENTRYSLTVLTAGAKLQLALSETYQYAVSKQKKRKQSLIKCLEMSSRDFAELCFK